MADAVTTNVIRNVGSEYIVHLTNVSDGTGESAVVKVDKSGLTVSGVEPATLTIVAASWAIQGFARVQIIWDHTTDVVALALCGTGSMNFADGLKDPGTGGSGDLLLTAPAGANTGSYDILLTLRKE